MADSGVRVVLEIQDRMSTKLKTIQGELNKTQTKFKSVSTALKQANAVMKTQDAYIKKLTSTITTLSAAYTKAAASANKANAAYAKLAGKSASLSMGMPTGTSGFFTQMDKISNSANKVATATTNASAGTKKMNKSFGDGMAKAMAMAAVLGVLFKAFQSITEAIQNSSTAFRNFQVRMAEVSTIVSSDLENTMLGLSAGVRAMSLEYGKSADDLARGLYDILSAAVPVEDSLNLLNTAAKAATAGLTDVSTSVDVLTSVMNAYGYSAAQMANVSDVMFQAVIRGKFRYEDLANALGYVTPIAAQAGVSFEELAASISSATRQGQHVDMVARGLALTIQNIIKPSQQAAEAANLLGLDLSLASLQADGLEGFLQKLAIATGNNAAKIAEIIPNMRSYRVAMVLASDEASEFSKDLELMENAGGATDTAFNKIASTVDMTKNILIQYREEMERLTGESTYGIEQLGIKWETFTSSLVNQWAQGFETFDNPDIFHRIANALTLGIGEAVVQTKESTRKAMETINEYMDEQIDRTMNPEKYAAKTPLFDLMMGGEKGDFSEYDTLSNLLDVQKQKAVETGLAIQALTQLKAGKTPEETMYLFKDMDENVKEGAFSIIRKALIEADGAMNLTDTQIQNLVADYEEWESAITDTEEELNYFTAANDDAGQMVEDLSTKIDTIIDTMSTLKDEIGQVGDMYDGTLGQQLKVAEVSKVNEEMSHWLSLAMEDSGYAAELAAQGYEWYSAELQAAVETVQEYEEGVKEATEAQNEFNFALAENAIAIKKLQLLGMMRRRGNTRAEERMLKQLSIERTELQIEEAERQLEEERNALNESGAAQNTAYEEAKKLIDDAVRDQEHLLWMTKDTRAQDIADLRATILGKEQAWNGYYLDITNLYSEMETAMGVHIDIQKALLGEESLEVQDLISFYQKLRDVQAGKIEGTNPSNTSVVKTAISKSFDTMQNNEKLPDIIRNSIGSVRTRLGLARGTDYIGSEGLYHLHKGEAVVPRNQNTSSPPVVVNVSVTGNTITDTNADSIASQVGRAVEGALVDRKSGKSNYRMR